jgi:hypothetical protein
MQSTQRNSSLAFAVFAALGFADLASAQAIIITNANNHQIPLAPGSSVQIDVDGNLRAQCALNSSNVCTQLSTGGPNQNAPTVTLGRSDADSDVRGGESIGLAWSSSNATVCSATQTGPVSTGWTGPRLATGGEQVNFATTGAGSYTFSLQCFNTNGGSAIASVPVTVAAPETGSQNPTGCTITSSDPAFRPAGYTEILKTWPVAFKSPNPNVTTTPVYPTSPGSPVPVGATKGTYTAIQFTSLANMTVDMTWDTAQAQLGYPSPRPADSMFISISPCAGDLRAPNSASGDPWLKPGCRQVSGAGSMFYTTRSQYNSNDVLCKIEPGQVYYINISPVDPGDGLTPGEHTCSTSAPNSASGCDVQMRHTGQ